MHDKALEIFRQQTIARVRLMPLTTSQTFVETLTSLRPSQFTLSHWKSDEKFKDYRGIAASSTISGSLLIVLAIQKRVRGSTGVIGD